MDSFGRETPKSSAYPALSDEADGQIDDATDDGLPVLATLVSKPRLATPDAKVDIFAAPRRYDLSTLFVVSIAYALLFASIRGLGGREGVAATIGGLVTVVGICQAALYGGNAPRLASVLSGTVYLLVIFAITMSIEAGVVRACAGLICIAPMAAMSGYLAGAMVGGVFLVAHYLRVGAEQRKECPRAPE